MAAPSGRPSVTLKLATSLDGRIALANGHKQVDHGRGGARGSASPAGGA